MNKFNERKLKMQDTCEVCKHCSMYMYPECGDCYYCMLGVSKKDADFVSAVRFGQKEKDERYAEIMMLPSPNTYIGDSPRLVASYNVCQFFKRDKGFEIEEK